MTKTSRAPHTALKLTSRSAEATQQVGEQLGGCLAAGDVVGLVGELGSGKTTLTQGIAKGLSIDPGTVKSPTFVLLREYHGRVRLTHIDGYRLEDPSAAVWLDLEYMFSPTQVTVIEWAERLVGCLPADYLEVSLRHKTTHQRTIEFFAHGPRSTELITALRGSIKQGEAAAPPREV